MTTSDRQFDSQFDKVENLVHYPWIGCNYASAPKRVLIMGDSHYTVNDEGEFCPEEYDRCVTDKEYTRGIINCAIEEGSWKFHTTFRKHSWMKATWMSRAFGIKLLLITSYRSL